jgi:hypothetical protein
MHFRSDAIYGTFGVVSGFLTPVLLLLWSNARGEFFWLLSLVGIPFALALAAASAWLLAFEPRQLLIIPFVLVGWVCALVVCTLLGGHLWWGGPFVAGGIGALITALGIPLATRRRVASYSYLAIMLTGALVAGVWATLYCTNCSSLGRCLLRWQWDIRLEHHGSDPYNPVSTESLHDRDRLCPRLHKRQTLATQRALLTKAGVKQIFSEKVSGIARPALEHVLDEPDAGDRWLSPRSTGSHVRASTSCGSSSGSVRRAPLLIRSATYGRTPPHRGQTHAHGAAGVGDVRAQLDSPTDQRRACRCARLSLLSLALGRELFAAGSRDSVP